MTDFRCRSHNLAMGESSPYAQRYDYGSEHPMVAMISPTYFLSQRDRLRAGDRIHLNRHETSDHKSRVLEYAEVLVVIGGNELDFEVVTPPTTVGAKKVEKVKKAA